MDDIDQLSEIIKNFGITKNKNKFEDDLENIMLKLDNVQIEKDSNEEWDSLQSNYSKIKYLYETINFYNIPQESKFINSLKKFMEIIDQQTLYYLNQINFDNPDPELSINDECAIIKDSMEKSINENDPIKKLNFIMKAYNVLVEIVEEIRDETMERTVEPTFLIEFQPPPKRYKK
jgi:hypothetical protein